MKAFGILILGLIFHLFLPFAYGAELQTGPMIGQVNLTQATLLVQTTESAEVRIKFWPDGTDPNVSSTWTDPVLTEKQDGFMTQLSLYPLLSGTKYHYEVWINGEAKFPQYRNEYRSGQIPLQFTTQPNWRFRESGHEIFDFTFAMGSCAYINQPIGGYDRLNSNPYGGEYQIFESIYEKDPDFFIWLGDNVYYRENDWTSREGMIQRWTHDRSIPHLRPLLATTPQFATWDDHDYGPNDTGREFWHKKEATEVFNLFNANPTAGLPELPGIFTFFNWGDVNFYLMDNRTYRDPQDVVSQSKSLLGKAQIDWLINLLVYAESQKSSSYPISFHCVVVGNQVLSRSGKSDFLAYPEEWNYLMDRLSAERIKNVVFLTGDVHFGEVNRYRHPIPEAFLNEQEDNSSIEFWEVTSSPLTAGSWQGRDQSTSPYRVDIFDGESDRVGQRNFVTLSVLGELGNRRMEIRYFDSNGKLINHQSQNPSQITPESIIYQK